MTIVSRFAPSPTGPLHLGHAWSAIQAHDAARAAGGRFVLRIEDTDVTRCRPEWEAAILEDMAWLGLGWDQCVRQSDRLALYDAALETLKGQGLAYPCFCTRAEIAREVASSLHAPHGADGPLYPGTCRALDRLEARDRTATEPHSWRLDASATLARTGPLWWEDAGAGRVAVDVHALGDLVLKGKDRPASYHLAVVVDDAAQGITDVVRGADVFASTHAHRLLQALLGLPTPRYRHHRLIGDAAGTRLAKRSHAPSLASLREAGMNGTELASKLREGRLPPGFSWA